VQYADEPDGSPAKGCAIGVTLGLLLWAALLALLLL
jgi:hypothetical protein